MTDYFPLQSLIEFARDKPPGETYSSYSPQKCALAQFGKFVRSNFSHAGCSGFWTDDGQFYTFELANGSRTFHLWDTLYNSETWGQLHSNLLALNVGAYVPRFED